MQRANASADLGGVRHVVALPCDQLFISALPIAQKRSASFFAQCIGAGFINRAALDQRRELDVDVRPNIAVIAAIIKRGAGDDFVRLLDNRFKGKARRTIARSGIGLGTLDQFAQRPPGIGDAGNIVLHVFIVFSDVKGDQQLREGALNGAHLLEHIPVFRELLGRFALGEHEEEHIIGRLRFVIERRIVKFGLHFGRCVLKPFEVRCIRLGSIIIEPVLIGIAAKEGLAFRAAGDLFFIFDFKPRVQPVAYGQLRSCLRRVCRRCIVGLVCWRAGSQRRAG